MRRACRVDVEDKPIPVADGQGNRQSRLAESPGSRSSPAFFLTFYNVRVRGIRQDLGVDMLRGKSSEFSFHPGVRIAETYGDHNSRRMWGASFDGGTAMRFRGLRFAPF